MINYRTYPAIVSAATFSITFATSVILMQIFPEICWLPRVGGVLVGLSVFMQGYMHANICRFRTPRRWGLTREQVYAHVSYHFAIFGTILWAFGDLLPKVFWLPNSACAT
jgi:hypothetical protein